MVRRSALAAMAAQAPGPRCRAELLGASAGLASAAALCLSLPPLRALIEQSMVWHMLVQMPLLLLAGCLFGMMLAQRPADAFARSAACLNRYGLSGFMLAQCVAAYWMVPAMIDRAVVLPAADAAKLGSLWLAGMALHGAFRQAPAAVQVFFVGYALPMMVWLGYYLASTDLRLCNAYALESQVRAGWGLVLLAAAAGLVWALALQRRLAHDSPV